MTTSLFLIFVAAGLATAFFLRARFSGKNFKLLYFIPCVIFNLFLAAFYMELVDKSCILFYGCFPTLHDNFPVIVWTSLVCIFVHCMVFPVEWEPKRWFRKRRTNGVDL